MSPEVPQGDVDHMDFAEYMNDVVDEAFGEWAEEHGKINPMWAKAFFDVIQEEIP